MTGGCDKVKISVRFSRRVYNTTGILNVVRAPLFELSVVIGNLLLILNTALSV